MPYAGVSYGSVLVCENDSVGVGRRSYGVVALATLVTAFHCGVGKSGNRDGICNHITALEIEGCVNSGFNVGNFNIIFTCYKCYRLSVDYNFTGTLGGDNAGHLIGLACLVCRMLIEDLHTEVTRALKSVGKCCLVSISVVTSTANGYVRTTPPLVIPIVPYACISYCACLVCKNDIVGTGSRRSNGVTAAFVATFVATFNCCEGKTGDGDSIALSENCTRLCTALKCEGCIGCIVTIVVSVLNNGKLDMVLTCYECYLLAVDLNVTGSLGDDSTGKLISLACLVSGILIEDLHTEPASNV